MIEFSAEQYVDDVLSGEILACKHVVAACQRHRNDLETGRERGLQFDEDAARLAVAFFPVACRHSKGEWSGRPIVLEPWQQFIVWSAFGWMRWDREDEQWVRRFRTVYVEVARKNGKSTLVSGMGLKLLVADDEPGAEIYTAATKKEQARIIHSMAVQTVKKSPALKKELKIFKDNIHSEKTFSKFAPLGKDSHTEDGLNVHGALIDELHAHPNGDMYSVLDTATGARRQPMIVMITTAGSDHMSFCREMRDFSEMVLEGSVEDDSHFAVIYTLDEGDDWRNEHLWIKANPNLGVSKKWEDMRSKKKKALLLPSQRNLFKQKELDLWVQSVSRWLDWEQWKGCGAQIDESWLYGRTCFAGLDLSSVSDITAWVLVFPPEGTIKGQRGDVAFSDRPMSDRWVVLPRFFLPEATVQVRSEGNKQGQKKSGRVKYDVWSDAGLLLTTPGNVLDYDAVYNQIDEDSQLFRIKHVGYDPWNGVQIANRLIGLGGSDWAAQIRQGHATLSGPCKSLERLVISQQLAHPQHAVLNWMASNVVVRRDTNDNIAPDKDKSREKIDGISATANAMSVAMRFVDLDQPKSIYDSRGIREL